MLNGCNITFFTSTTFPASSGFAIVVFFSIKKCIFVILSASQKGQVHLQALATAFNKFTIKSM